MGYRVDYGPVRKIRGMEKRFSRPAALTGLFFFVFLLMTAFLWPEGVQVLRDLVVPGDPAVTAAAVEALTDDLRSGAPAMETIYQFLQRMLEEGSFAANR